MKSPLIFLPTLKPLLFFQHLQAVDSEIRDGNMEILNRFFLAFESIHKYASDLNQFVEELNDGIYLQNNLQNLFSNGEAKQLLVR